MQMLNKCVIKINVIVLRFTQVATGFVTRLTRRVPLVEQELLTLPEHMSSPDCYCYSIFSFMSMFCRF